MSYQEEELKEEQIMYRWIGNHHPTEPKPNEDRILSQ